MFRLPKRATPSTPPSNTGRIYYDSDGRPYLLNESGILMPMVYTGLRDQNLLINGSFDYAQRGGASSSVSINNTNARGFLADRWGMTNENTNINYQRQDTSGSPQTAMTARFYGQFVKTTSTGKFVVSQTIESGNCLHVRGRKVRLQGKIRCSASKTIRMALLQLTSAGTIDTIPGYASGAPSGTFVSAYGANGTDPTFGTNLSKIAPDTNSADNCTIANTGLTISATTTFQRFGSTFTAPSDFKNLIVAVWTDSQFAANDRLEMTEMGLYDGPEIRDWAERMQVTQLINCQRYYAKTFLPDTAPAQNAGVGTGEAKGIAGKAGAVANAGIIAWRFPTSMRITPAVTGYNPGVANANMRDLTASVDHTTNVFQTNTEATRVTSTGNASTAVGDEIGLHMSADAEL